MDRDPRPGRGTQSPGDGWPRLTCQEITEQATSYMEDGLPLEARRLVEAHLAECEGCRALLAQLHATVRVAGGLPAAAPSPEARAAALRQFAAWKAASAALAPAPVQTASGTTGRRAALAVLAVVAVTAILAGAGRHPSHEAADFALAAALATAAAGVAAFAGRLTGRLALVVSAALAASLVRGGAGAVDLGQGLDCLLTELAAAGGLALVAGLVARRTAIPAGVGAWAVAGAMAGDAALRITCGAHQSLPHLALFHAGSVLAVLAIAALVARRAVAPAGAAA
jgi:hypothetical protein